MLLYIRQNVKSVFLAQGRSCEFWSFSCLLIIVQTRQTFCFAPSSCQYTSRYTPIIFGVHLLIRWTVKYWKMHEEREREIESFRGNNILNLAQKLISHNNCVDFNLEYPRDKLSVCSKSRVLSSTFHIYIKREIFYIIFQQRFQH